MITAKTALLNLRIEINLMAREYSLFYIGTPEEKLALGLCPHGKCIASANDGFGDEADDPLCCCKHCWDKHSVDRRPSYCINCPAPEAYNADE